MSVGVSFDTEALTDLRVEKCIECVLPLSERVDFSSHRDHSGGYASQRLRCYEDSEDAAVSASESAGGGSTGPGHKPGRMAPLRPLVSAAGSTASSPFSGQKTIAADLQLFSMGGTGLEPVTPSLSSPRRC